jgi:glycosyltransferase involved in cell wall biosynthesis
MFRPWKTTVVRALPAAPPWTLVSARIKRTARVLYMNVRDTDSEMPPVGGGRVRDEASVPLIIATLLRGDGVTGVETHIRQLRRFLQESGTASTLVTPFSWGRPLTYPVFGLRPLVLERCSRPASLAWYLYWHEAFLRRGLGRRLANTGECVVDTQDPWAARAALRARRGPHQRVVMTVHFSVSTADLWVDKKQIKRDGTVFRAIRQVEAEVIPQVDGLVYVSGWARDALVGWLPEAAVVPSAVIGNFVAPLPAERPPQALGDLVTIGNLEIAKNHRFLLTVLAEAKRAGRSFSLDIFGEGPCRGDLLRQARALGLEEQVRFRGFRPDVRDLLPGYQVYVHASYTESSSLAIMEAMAAGLPIVAGGIGPIPELCDDGVEARFWPLDDPARAAVLLMDLLDCEPERLKAARAARERFHRDYDADVVGPKLRSFLMGDDSRP